MTDELDLQTMIIDVRAFETLWWELQRIDAAIQTSVEVARYPPKVEEALTEVRHSIAEVSGQLHNVMLPLSSEIMKEVGQ